MSKEGANLNIVIQQNIEDEFKEFIYEVLEDYLPKWDYSECSLEELENAKDNVKIIIWQVGDDEKEVLQVCGIKQMFYSDLEYFILILENEVTPEYLMNYKDPSLRVVSKDEDAIEDLLVKIKEEKVKSMCLDLPLGVEDTREIVNEATNSSKEPQIKMNILNNSSNSVELYDIEKSSPLESENKNEIQIQIEEDNGQNQAGIEFESLGNTNNIPIDDEQNKRVTKPVEATKSDEKVLKENKGKDNKNDKDLSMVPGKTSCEDDNSNCSATSKQKLEEGTQITCNGVPIDKTEIKKIAEERRKYEKRILSLRDFINIPVYKKKTIPHKAIGIWSPLHRSGVTTLAINFSLYLSDYSFPIGVLEAITINMKQKNTLSLFSDKPENWQTYSKYLMGEGEPKQAIWDVKGIHFYPFIEKDKDLNWTEQAIEYFVEGLKFYDLLLVDLPTGKMEEYTLNTLKYLDELWIVVNNDITGILQWKNYINEVIKSSISCKLIFNEHLNFSKPELLEKELDIPLMATVPSMHIEINKNQYKTIPLIEQDQVYNKLEGSFVKMLECITGNKKKIIRFEAKNSSTSLEIFLKKFLKNRKI